MSAKPYLLLDAGGTLLFIDQVYLSQTAQALGFQVEAARFYEEHFRIMHWLDAYIRDHRQFPPRVNKPYPQILFESVGLPEEAAAQAGQAAEAAHKEKNLWTFTLPWVAETLDCLSAEGYRMSIISNSDGRVEQQLLDLGLRGYFERVYDSKVVGTQKPDPRIFHLALADLGLRPEEAVYVGDAFYIDIWGANRAGVPAVHLDPLGLYVGWPGEHIQDVRQLPGWLQGYVQARQGYDVLPLRDFAMLPGDE
ncbi:MAG: HAD family hydrolase [Anaerolineae bacterium]|nr:HAD family hydrolase [Anaerolineae bacterium]